MIENENNSFFQNTNDTECNKRENQIAGRNMSVKDGNKKSTVQLNTENQLQVDVADTDQVDAKSDTEIDAEKELEAEITVKSKEDDKIARNANGISEENGEPKRRKMIDVADIDRCATKSNTKDRRHSGNVFEWTPIE